tara:strand:- start:1054 stop:1908 length:855 start_codon:yes stop_codon:yes gene_type:complete
MNKNTKKNKKFIKLNCSPKSEFKYTCLNSKTLFKLRDEWNKKNKNKIITNNPKKIWLFLKNNLKDCNNEKCWLDNLIKNKNKTQKIKDNLFRPISPESWINNPVEWLSSNDIIKVMEQYEKKFNDFKFLGPSPIDFNYKKMFNECVWEDLCKFNLKKYNDLGYKKIGIIFNTDPHYKSGAHWVCLFINISLNYIYFFDSTGDKPQKEIVKLIKKIQKQATNLKINLKLIINQKEHQKGDTECGMYVLVIIILLLKNKKEPKDFHKIRIPDKKMIEIRNILFNKI